MCFSSPTAAGSKQGRMAAAVCGTGGDQERGERENSLEDHLSADVRGEPEQRSRVFSPKENCENKIEMFEVQRKKEKRREPFSGYKCICFQTSVKKL